ncbi:MAG: serine/threonine protein kinase [Sandaracinaceae bacterium]
MIKICPACKSQFEGGEVFCPNDGARLVTPSQWEGRPANPAQRDDGLIGTLLNERYKILRLIGEGGMGRVYEAEHVAIEKPVALKVLRDDFSGRPEVVQRFKQEAKSASRIGNDHIVDISDFGETPRGAAYFVMELLEGEDLANVLTRAGTLPVARAADIILQCCVALAAAHKKGIVHRDMKPENVFLTTRDGKSDFVKLVDFGIAKMSDIETDGPPGRKLTKTGMIFGTPEYMSPEQAAGKPLDHRVDIYALAVIMFEMVTGRVPFVGDTFMGILTQHMFEDPPALADVNPKIDCSPEIAGFIYRGLSKEADQRYQSCEEMAQALKEALAGRSVGPATYVGYGDPNAVPMGRAPRARASDSVPASPASSPRWPLVVGVGLIALVAIGAGAFWALGTGDGTVAVAAVEDPREDPPDEDDPTLGSVGGPPPTAAPDAGPGEAPPDAGPSEVTLTVNTSPSGAQVFVEGRGLVCERSPCRFTVPASTEPITVRALRRGASAEVELIPTDDQTVPMPELARQGSARRGGGATEDTSGGGGSNSSGGSARRGGAGTDLKTPPMWQ